MPELARRAKERVHRFMTAMAGDLPNYEEATRMLFAGDWTAFDAAVESWPEGCGRRRRRWPKGRDGMGRDGFCSTGVRGRHRIALTTRAGRW
ncbi:hypothetical protein GCM10009116_12050 [Brevundimonas basaltis]